MVGVYAWSQKVTPPPPPSHVSHTLNCLDGRNLSRPFFHVVPPSLILFQLFHSCIGGKLIIETYGTPTHSMSMSVCIKLRYPFTLSYPYTSLTLTAPPEAEILHAPSARSNGGRSQEFWVIEEPFVRICNGMITKVCTVLEKDVPLINKKLQRINLFLEMK